MHVLPPPANVTGVAGTVDGIILLDSSSICVVHTLATTFLAADTNGSSSDDTRRLLSETHEVLGAKPSRPGHPSDHAWLNILVCAPLSWGCTRPEFVIQLGLGVWDRCDKSLLLQLQFASLPLPKL